MPNLDTVPLKHKIRVHLQESSLWNKLMVLLYNPVMKSQCLLIRDFWKNSWLGILQYLIRIIRIKKIYRRKGLMWQLEIWLKKKAGYLWVACKTGITSMVVWWGWKLSNETILVHFLKMNYHQLKEALVWFGMVIVLKLCRCLVSVWGTIIPTRLPFIWLLVSLLLSEVNLLWLISS